MNPETVWCGPGVPSGTGTRKESLGSILVEFPTRAVCGGRGVICVTEPQGHLHGSPCDVTLDLWCLRRVSGTYSLLGVMCQRKGRHWPEEMRSDSTTDFSTRDISVT